MNKIVKLVASTQGLSHSRLTWDSRLEVPALYCSTRMCASVCLQHGRAHCLWATTESLSDRRLPGAPCSVPGHQLQQKLSPFPLYWKWCGLPYRVSNTTPTYLQNFWRCLRPSITVLEKYIIMTSAHWKGMRWFNSFAASISFFLFPPIQYFVKQCTELSEKPSLFQMASSSFHPQ